MNDVKWKSQYGFTFNLKELDAQCYEDKSYIGIYMIWSEENGRVIRISSGPIYELWNLLEEGWYKTFPGVLIVNYVLCPINKSYDDIRGFIKYLSNVYHPLEKVEGLFEGIEPQEIDLPTLPKLPASTQE